MAWREIEVKRQETDKTAATLDKERTGKERNISNPVKRALNNKKEKKKEKREHLLQIID